MGRKTQAFSTIFLTKLKREVVRKTWEISQSCEMYRKNLKYLWALHKLRKKHTEQPQCTSHQPATADGQTTAQSQRTNLWCTTTTTHLCSWGLTGAQGGQTGLGFSSTLHASYCSRASRLCRYISSKRGEAKKGKTNCRGHFILFSYHIC